MKNRTFRRLAPAISLAAVALAPLVFAADAPEWPRFRGPLGNPVSTGRLPDTWSKTENVEWTASIPGRGWSSPIVSGGKVFVTAATTDGASKKPQIGTQYSNEYVAELQKQGLSEKEIDARVTERDFELPDQVTLHYFLYCVDLKSGKVSWKQEYHAGRPPGGRHRKNSFTSETPVTDGKLVYVYATSLGLWAYDMKGRLVWKTPLENYPMYGDFGTGASPALVGDLLVIVNDNEKQQFIAAFDKKTGKQVWRTDRDLKAGTSAAGAALRLVHAVHLDHARAHRDRHDRPGLRRQLRRVRQGTVAAGRHGRRADSQPLRVGRAPAAERRDPAARSPR